MANRETRRKRGARGNAVVELSLLAPWIFFLFVGVMDFGFYAYSLIATENAARAAALYTSSGSQFSGDSYAACQYALAELRSLPNARSLVNCNSLPLIVTVTPLDATQSVDGFPASRVDVTYQTVALIPIPGLAGQFTITRRAEMRVKAD